MVKQTKMETIRLNRNTFKILAISLVLVSCGLEKETKINYSGSSTTKLWGHDEH